MTSKDRNILTIHIKMMIVFVGFLIIGGNSSAVSGKSMLSDPQMIDVMKKNLISREDWHPYPTADEREKWMALPQVGRRIFIARGNKCLRYKWPSLPATLFLEYVREGNRSNYERQRSNRRNTLCNLVMAECLEGKGRFMDDIANGVWAICEESYWGVPAHLSLQKAGHGLPDIAEPTVDLFAGETASLLAWTCYLLGTQLDEISPLLRERVQLELNERVLTPCLQRDDFWWMGFQGNRVNNWNPWCNSNWLTTVLLIETDNTKRVAAVEKIMKSLDNFIASYPADGGCDEGPVYWNRAGASLFDCLELLYSATNSAINVYDESLIQEMGRYIYRVHINDNYFTNFADASAKVNIFYDLAHRYGKRINDDLLVAFGAYAAQQRRKDRITIYGSINRQLPAIFNLSELINEPPKQPLLRDVWMESVQLMAARSQENSVKGLYVAAKGGHNDESHNHNDVGNFIVYKDGQPMIIDVGVETYSAKTFSRQRYGIWTMQSMYHNLPTINDVMQQAGKKFAAKNVSYIAEDSFAQLKLDISEAYPQQAGINSWERTIRLNRGEDIQVTDNYDLAQEVQEITQSLMTPRKVQIDTAGQITLYEDAGNAGQPQIGVYVFYDAEKMTASTENIPIEDNMLKSVWGESITRIILRAQSPPLRDTWTLRITP